MNQDWMQRHRLKFAWLLIALLLAVLALREGLAQWREVSQWRGWQNKPQACMAARA